MDFKDVLKYTKELSVLYIEDDESVMKNTSDVLEKFFNSIDTAVNGEEGLILYKNYFTNHNNYYDLVITDLSMPIMDGETLIDHIHNINYEQMIIVISAYSESSRLMNLIELGISDFLLKPISLSKIINVLYKTAKILYDQKEKVKLEIEKNILLERKIFHQEKMNSMNSMIQNIAHQWRQPLSIISTNATGMIFQKELGTLTDEIFMNSCNQINEHTQYLSDILDNFIGFIDGNIENKVFYLNDKIDISLNLLETQMKNSDIDFILNIDENLKVYGCSNEFMQCIMDILVNSYEKFNDMNTKEKYIFIDTEIKNNTAIIHIKDNANGIDSKDISKVFEPYFTTSHQSQGKGLGMYMTYNYITEGMGGNIEIENDTYEYNGKNYTGALITIELPLYKD
ncbi:MAG: response regulator [Campylobacterota bacterium]|nr:response regulator [Campylobacterota bacterium]